MRRKEYPEYESWRAMKKRCYYPKHQNYARYGGRGIRVCDRWLHDFPTFLEDMGNKPSSIHTLDRKDNDGNYEPDNCKWATPKEQQNNRRNNIKIRKIAVKHVVPYCSLLDCYREYSARGFCKMHYKRIFKKVINGKEVYA
jgi:hypothetical protein